VNNRLLLKVQANKPSLRKKIFLASVDRMRLLCRVKERKKQRLNPRRYWISWHLEQSLTSRIMWL
jgi:hypothetical protein